MPESIRDGLIELADSGCVPVLLFTNKGHDGNRAWWAGASLGPYRGYPKHKKAKGKGYRLPHTLVFDNAVFVAFDHVPDKDEVAHLNGLPRPRILMLHEDSKRMKNIARLEALRPVFSYVACGDCHEPKAIVEHFLHYSGSPSFRDLSSIDLGPRSFLDVEIGGGRVTVAPKMIDTPLLVSLEIKSGLVIADAGAGQTKNYPSLPAALGDGAKYGYAKVEADAEQLQAIIAGPPNGWTVGPVARKSLLLARK
jgi:hypothetical protein